MPNMVTFNRKHYIFYRGQNERHDCNTASKRMHIGVATYNLDRFVALRLGHGAQGEVDTVPIVVGGNLFLDVNVPENSSILVQLIDATLERVVVNLCKVTNVNHNELLCGKESALSAVNSHVMRLRFILEGRSGTDLFGFRFGK